MQLKKVKLIAPSSYQEKLCDLFSKEVFHNSESGKTYMDRTKNSGSENKIIADIYLGKMAEYAVWNYLVSQDKFPTEPELAIYSNKRKSYDADLKIGNTKIHVKSCVYNEKFSNSWVFRPNDPIVTNPDENDFVILCALKDNTFEGILVSAKKLVGMHKPPRNPNYNMSVIYEEDLLGGE